MRSEGDQFGPEGGDPELIGLQKFGTRMGTKSFSGWAKGDDCFRDGPFGSNLKTAHYASSSARVIRLQNIGDGSVSRQGSLVRALGPLQNR